jgi:hypothetical protein
MLMLSETSYEGVAKAKHLLCHTAGLLRLR